MTTRRICFTQNNYTTESIQALLEESRFSYLIFGKEVGESGTKHLQGYAEFHKPTKYAGIAKIHKMHCEVTRGTQQQAIDYCKKDGDWVEKGELKDHMAGSTAAQLKRLEAIQDPLAAFDRGDLLPGQLTKLVLDIDTARCMRERQDKKQLEGFIPNTFGALLPVIKGKQRHYWIWSDMPNKGKTTFLESLKQLYKADYYSYAETFQNIHLDTEILMLDEYSTAHLKVTQLNLMCDGTYNYPRKGINAIAIKPIIIICGNTDPRLVYPNAFKYIEARFNIIELK